tara:strand:- start:247 stop:597 length:351 start_codon:yes stop_codon:yes gene_type:complete
MSWEDVLKSSYYTDRRTKRHKKELKREAKKKKQEDRAVNARIKAGEIEMEKISEEMRNIKMGLKRKYHGDYSKYGGNDDFDNKQYEENQKKIRQEYEKATKELDERMKKIASEIYN